MTLEPTGLECNGAALGGPVSPVLRQVDTAARVDPLHSIGVGLVGDKVVAAPAWVGDDCVGCAQRSAGEHEYC